MLDEIENYCNETTCDTCMFSKCPLDDERYVTGSEIKLCYNKLLRTKLIDKIDEFCRSFGLSSCEKDGHTCPLLGENEYGETCNGFCTKMSIEELEETCNKIDEFNDWLSEERQEDVNEKIKSDLDGYCNSRENCTGCPYYRLSGYGCELDKYKDNDDPIVWSYLYNKLIDFLNVKDVTFNDLRVGEKFTFEFDTTEYLKIDDSKKKNTFDLTHNRPLTIYGEAIVVRKGFDF